MNIDNQFKKIVSELRGINDFYADIIENHYQNLSMKEKLEYLKLSEQTKAVVMAVKEVTDKIENEKNNQ